MSTIRVLKTANAESRLQDQSRARSGCRPTSLLAFLQAENRRLQNTVAQLQRETMALREALQNS
jgi:hypothetical protein